MSVTRANDVVIPILLPQAGNSMEEGTILAWRVKPGDRVKVGDVLFELETDKATLEVEAEVDGRISKILVGEGQTAAVKTPVAYFAEHDDVVLDAVAGASPAVEAVAVSLGVSSDSGAVELVGDLTASRQRVSPVARRAAADLGVDLSSLSGGSGPDGRIVLDDVKAASKNRVVPPSAPSGSVAGAIPANSGGERRPMSKMRKAIARNLSISKQTLPHWYLKLSIDAGPLVAFYRKEKALYPCSINDVIVLALSRVLLEFPLFRTQIDGDQLVEFAGANIGLAVGIDEGLVVPVIRNADSLSLKGIAQETRRLAEQARQGKIEGVGEGVFTISNLGMFGVEEFVAIVNPPESGILAVGAVREEVVVKDGALRIGQKLTLVLSADHRIIDGTVGAKFMARLRELLEDPHQVGGR